MSALSVTGRWIEYGQDELLEAFYVTPDASAPRRGTILLLQEIFGVNAAMRHIAEIFAGEGFNVIVPDLFSHIERRVDLGYDPASRNKGFELMQQLDMERAIGDCRAAVAWTADQDSSNGKSAVVGFCIGGQLAVRFAAAQPLDAAIAFYGVRVDAYPDQLRAIECPFQYHVGGTDAHIPAASIDTVAAVLAPMPHASLFVYPRAGHGFFNPVRTDVFDPDAFAVAYRRTTQLLRECLG